MTAAMVSLVHIVDGPVGDGIKRAWVGGCKDVGQW